MGVNGSVQEDESSHNGIARVHGGFRPRARSQSRPWLCSTWVRRQGSCRSLPLALIWRSERKYFTNSAAFEPIWVALGRACSATRTPSLVVACWPQDCDCATNRQRSLITQSTRCVSTEDTS